MNLYNLAGANQAPASVKASARSPKVSKEAKD